MNRVFVQLMRDNDMEKYSELCNDFNQSIFQLIKKHDLNLNDDNIRSTFDKEHLELEMKFRKTREEFLNYCKNKKK